MQLKLYKDIEQRLLKASNIDINNILTQGAIERFDAYTGLPPVLLETIQNYIGQYNELMSTSFQLRYYQVLALLFTEQFFINKQEKKLVQNMLAYWMATGSGKTLVMHLNVIQYLNHLHHFDHLQIILTTPGVNLIRQHEREFKPFIDRLNQEYNHRIELLIDTTAGLLQKEEAYFKLLDDEAVQRLILVDEGHIGLSSKGEGEYKKLRDRLNARNSFLFEYSATYHNLFSKVQAEYEKTIVYDYNYARFYNDGYGKDYYFKKITQDTVTQSEKDNLDECFSTLQEKLRAFQKFSGYINQEQHAVFGTGFPDKPLLAFMGNTVENPKDEGQNDEVSDIRKVIRYLARLSQEEKRAFKHCFNDQYTGALTLTRNREAQDEILLSYGDGDYWGIINVGNGDKFYNDTESGNGYSIQKRTAHILDRKYLFENLDEKGSPINVLIGSRKFAEGWNSFRLSVIGLINLGTSKGNKIIQIFGRGVRLRGTSDDGKRQYTEHLEDYYTLQTTDEDDRRRLETLTVFSLTKSYLETFIKAVQEEVRPALTFTIKVNPVIFKLDDGTEVIFDQYRKDVPIFKLSKKKVGKKRVLLDQGRFTYAYLNGNHEQQVTLDSFEINKLDFRTDSTKAMPSIKVDLEKVNEDASYRGYLDRIGLQQHIQQQTEKAGLQLYRKANGSLHEAGVLDLLPFVKEVYYQEHFNPSDIDTLDRLNRRVAEEVIKKIKNKINYDINARNYVYDEPLNQSTDAEKHDFIYAYTVTKTFDTLEEKEAFEREVEKQSESIKQMLVLHDLDRHIYEPLLDEERKGDLKFSPKLLNPGERKFIEDISQHIRDRFVGQSRYAFYLMRNEETLKSIGLYLETDEGVFYPDFILWVLDREEDKTTIVFIDPKGQSGIIDDRTLNLNDKVTIAQKEGEDNPLVMLEEQLTKKHGKTFELHSFLLLRDSSPLGKGQTDEWVEENMIRRNVLRLDWHEKREDGASSYLWNDQSYLDLMFDCFGVYS